MARKISEKVMIASMGGIGNLAYMTYIPSYANSEFIVGFSIIFAIFLFGWLFLAEWEHKRYGWEQ